jgi:hypothetical protein
MGSGADAWPAAAWSTISTPAPSTASSNRSTAAAVKVGERHRYDNRLSMAVLTRLDARLDRAEARGDAHLRVARRWDDYLDALGADRADEAQALLAAPEPEPEEIAETAQHCDLHDVEEVEMDEDDEETRALHFYNGMSAWQEHGVWWTDSPAAGRFRRRRGRANGAWTTIIAAS